MKARSYFVDTTVFLRYLTNDVPEEAAAVEQLLRRAATGEVALQTNAVVVAEIVWTLESFYRLSREGIERVVLAILNTPGLEVEGMDLIVRAITWYARKQVGFIDAYNAAWMWKQGLTDSCSFDRRRFARLEEITVVLPGQDEEVAGG